MTDDLDYAKQILEVIPPTMRAIRTEMRGFAKNQLTVPQFRILNHLSREISTNGELAEWMGVTSPTMSRMVNALAERDFIERIENSTDRRQVSLSLSKKGKTILDTIRGSVQKGLAEKFTSLASKEKQILSEGLLVLKKLLLKKD